jgi:hypothetical protein
MSGRVHALVAFLDVADSRGMYRRLGDDAAHDRIDAALSRLEHELIGRGGEIIKRVGDAVLCLFEDCAQGVAALGDVQRAGRLSFRVGAHHGPVLAREGDVFGDTVNRAARLAALARSREVLLSASVAEQLPESLRDGCHPVERLRLKGDEAPELVFRFSWEGVDSTRVNTALSITAVKVKGELCLDTPSGRVRLEPGESYRVGRDHSCDLVLEDVRVSRFHATLEWRRGRCVLCDHSTNGSYVRSADATRAVFIRREEMPLVGVGRVSFAALDEGPALEFHYE